MAAITHIGGWVGDRVRNNSRNWLAHAPFSSSALFAGYRYRNLPAAVHDTWFPDKCPFAAEFPGKLLVSICECLKLEPENEELWNAGRYLTDQLKQIGSDGYLGLFCKEERYIGHEGRREWDVWGAYHILWGLLLWKDISGDQASEALMLRSADELCRFFLEEKHDLTEGGELFANLSAGRIFFLLFEQYGRKIYWEMGMAFIRALESEGFDLLGSALKKQSFHHTVVGGTTGRWELLHNIVMLGDLARITGDRRYDEALDFYWHDIFCNDVHNTGGYSSGEGSVGNPFSLGAVELCCSIMWADVTTACWHRFHLPELADELELTFYNALLGSQHPTGRWWTYSSPMFGKKRPVEDIVVYQGFHFDGSHEMNCCAANSGRGVGLLGNWAAAAKEDRLYLNYYGECEICAEIQGTRLLIRQQTAYPRNGAVKLTLHPEHNFSFTLMLRIPKWAANTCVYVNGKAVACKAGEYLALSRVWAEGDTIDLLLDLSVHYLQADDRLDCLCSVYYGPLLLAFDHGKNPDFDWRRLCIVRTEDAAERRYYQPSMRGLKLTLEGVRFDQANFQLQAYSHAERWPEPLVHFVAKTADGESLHLIDYATAGMDNEWFTTWFDFSPSSTAN